MEEEILEARNLSEAPELIQNNLPDENLRYPHQNASLINDTADSESKERSPAPQRQYKHQTIVTKHFFSRGTDINHQKVNNRPLALLPWKNGYEIST